VVKKARSKKSRRENVLKERDAGKERVASSRRDAVFKRGKGEGRTLEGGGKKGFAGA